MTEWPPRWSKERAPAQLGLFESSPLPRPDADSALAERLRREHAEAAAIAARLPKGVFFGTSTWSFPGWAGIVYSRRATTAELAREGLAEYARHPLLTTVGIDRGYYGPIPARRPRAVRVAAPAGLSLLREGAGAVTDAASPDYSEGRAVRRRDGRARFRESFREHTGPFLLQFPPASRDATPSPGRFAERLGALSRRASARGALRGRAARPDAPLAGVRAALAARGAAHVYNYATAMPMPAVAGGGDSGRDRAVSR